MAAGWCGGPHRTHGQARALSEMAALSGLVIHTCSPALAINAPRDRILDVSQQLQPCCVQAPEHNKAAKDHISDGGGSSFYKA
jgi:hypothetical protein